LRKNINGENMDTLSIKIDVRKAERDFIERCQTLPWAASTECLASAFTGVGVGVPMTIRYDVLDQDALDILMWILSIRKLEPNWRTKMVRLAKQAGIG